MASNQFVFLVVSLVAFATEGEDEPFREDAAGGGAAQQQEYDSCSDISGN